MAISRWIAPAALAASLAIGAFTPAPAHAQSYDLTRAIVDIADVVFRGNQPYYRYGDYGQDDRLVMSRDRYGRPVYYRVVSNGYDNYNGYNPAYRTGYSAPPYGRAYGYRGQAPGRVKCNSHGKCKTEYYDPRYDRHDRDDRDDDRRWRGY
jgi:hypothetical protein